MTPDHGERAYGAANIQYMVDALGVVHEKCPDCRGAGCKPVTNNARIETRSAHVYAAGTERLVAAIDHMVASLKRDVADERVRHHSDLKLMLTTFDTIIETLEHAAAALRSAHDSKAAPPCVSCGAPAACIGSYEGNPIGAACNVCCGHGNEDGWCEPIGSPELQAKLVEIANALKSEVLDLTEHADTQSTPANAAPSESRE
jgi:hypothetical protein